MSITRGSLTVNRREKSLKRWARPWKIALIERDNPLWIDLWSGLGRRPAPPPEIEIFAAGPDVPPLPWVPARAPSKSRPPARERLRAGGAARNSAEIGRAPV